MDNSAVPDWISNPLKNELEKTKWLLSHEAQFVISRHSKGSERLTHNLQYDLDVMLNFISHSNSKKLFSKLTALADDRDASAFEELLFGYIPLSEKETEASIQLDIAWVIWRSLKPSDVSTPTRLIKWEKDIEKSIKKLLNLLRNSPVEKLHIRIFTPENTPSPAHLQRDQLFYDVLEKIAKTNLEESIKESLQEQIEEIQYERTKTDVPSTLFDQLKWLLSSGKIKEGKSLGVKTKGEIAARAYFIRLFTTSWQERFPSSAKPSHALIAEIASIIFSEIDEQGVSRLLTKWR